MAKTEKRAKDKHHYSHRDKEEKLKLWGDLSCSVRIRLVCSTCYERYLFYSLLIVVQ